MECAEYEIDKNRRNGPEKRVSSIIHPKWVFKVNEIEYIFWIFWIRKGNANHIVLLKWVFKVNFFIWYSKSKISSNPSFCANHELNFLNSFEFVLNSRIRCISELNSWIRILVNAKNFLRLTKFILKKKTEHVKIRIQEFNSLMHLILEFKANSKKFKKKVIKAHKRWVQKIKKKGHF